MKITLFGSASNPPHLGHALVIQDFLEAGLCDQLWLLPNVIHNFGKNMALPKHRLAMTRLFLDFLTSQISGLKSQVKLCPVELDLDLSGRSYDTLQALKSNSDYLIKKMMLTSNQLPVTSYSLLVGSDRLPAFDRWYRYQELLKEMTFYVYPRAGFPNEPLLSGMKLFTTPTQTITNISSTITRNKISARENLSFLLPADILSYIQTNKLYQ